MWLNCICNWPDGWRHHPSIRGSIQYHINMNIYLYVALFVYSQLPLYLIYKFQIVLILITREFLLGTPVSFVIKLNKWKLWTETAIGDFVHLSRWIKGEELLKTGDAIQHHTVASKIPRPNLLQQHCIKWYCIFVSLSHKKICCYFCWIATVSKAPVTSKDRGQFRDIKD